MSRYKDDVGDRAHENDATRRGLVEYIAGWEGEHHAFVIPAEAADLALDYLKSTGAIT